MAGPQSIESNIPIMDVMRSYIAPLILMALSARGFLSVIMEIVLKERAPAKIFNTEELRNRAFSWLWLNYGEMLSSEMTPGTDALLRTVRGTVLDLGPGAGEQLHRFSAPSITRAYAAEPCLQLHDKLLAKAREAGFADGAYVAMSCGAEQESLVPALAKVGLLGGERGGQPFDTIVCVRVLCGVPRPRETIAGLYRLLKPGGSLILCEHIRSWSGGEGTGSFLGGSLQSIYQLIGWSYLMGGCDLKRSTVEYVREAAGADGGWATENVQFSDGWTPIPHVVGKFIKKG